MKSSTIADAILRDRERRKSAAPRRKTALTPTGFARPEANNPFAGWHMAPVGWFITCLACAREFESKGWAYCPSCMELPAETRRREFDSGLFAYTVLLSPLPLAGCRGWHRNLSL
jgi:hypothetical protein